MRLVHVFARALCRWIWIKVPAHVYIAAFTGIGVCTGGALLFHAGAEISPPPILMAIAGMGQTADGDARPPLPLSGGELMDGHMPVAEAGSPQAAPAAGIYTPMPDPRAARAALLAPLLVPLLVPLAGAFAEPVPTEAPRGDGPGDPDRPAGGVTLIAFPAAQPAEIPEPGSAMLLLSAIAGLICAARTAARRGLSHSGMPDRPGGPPWGTALGDRPGGPRRARPGHDRR